MASFFLGFFVGVVFMIVLSVLVNASQKTKAEIAEQMRNKHE